MRKFWIWILPKSLFHGDRVTVSARRMLSRVAIGILALGGGLLAAGLLEATSWREVLAGALLAWSVSIVVWAIASYRRGDESTMSELRRTAEVDLLHGRLNQIACRVGAPLLIVDHELEHAIGARMERLAHFAGLDEFRERAHTNEEGHSFWTNEAHGYECQKYRRRKANPFHR